MQDQRSGPQTAERGAQPCWLLGTDTGRFSTVMPDEQLPLSDESNPNATATDEEDEFEESLNTFFAEFHRHIFNPVLFRLAALGIRQDLSGVPKGPF